MAESHVEFPVFGGMCRALLVGVFLAEVTQEALGSVLP